MKSQIFNHLLLIYFTFILCAHRAGDLGPLYFIHECYQRGTAFFKENHSDVKTFYDAQIFSLQLAIKK